MSVAVRDAERFRAEGWWRDRTAIDDLRAAVERHPGKTAFVARSLGRDETVELTFEELLRRTDRCAGGLLELGVQPGDVVTLQLPNWWELVVLSLACTRIGAVVGPVMPIMRRREMRHALGLTEAPVCVVPDVWRGFDHAAMLDDELAGELPSLRHVVVIGEPRPGQVGFAEHFGRPWEDEHPASELDALAPDPDAPAQILFTSGTTGEPKGVLHTHNTLDAAMRGEPEALELTGDDVITMGSPMTHQAGYLYCLLMPIALGATAVLQDVWDPGVLLDHVAEHRVTFTMGAPPFVLDAIAAQRREPRDVSSLHSFACGSAPVPPHVVEEVMDVLGARLHALWGMTENGTVTITRPEDPPMLAADSDGSPIPWMEVRIVDDEGGPVAEGEVGRLLVRGASQCAGYFRRPEVYAAALDDEGWFDTGDLARSDGHGGIRIAGRLKDLVMRGGENIPVLEVEAALYRHPRVREVAIVGYPDERLGERACAFVAAEGEPPDLPELQRHLDAAGMARQFWPERLEIVDELPKTPSGKVQKFHLRERLAG